MNNKIILVVSYTDLLKMRVRHSMALTCPGSGRLHGGVVKYAEFIGFKGLGNKTSMPFIHSTYSELFTCFTKMPPTFQYRVQCTGLLLMFIFLHLQCHLPQLPWSPMCTALRIVSWPDPFPLNLHLCCHLLPVGLAHYLPATAPCCKARGAVLWLLCTLIPAYTEQLGDGSWQEWDTHPPPCQSHRQEKVIQSDLNLGGWSCFPTRPEANLTLVVGSHRVAVLYIAEPEMSFFCGPQKRFSTSSYFSCR